MEQLFLRVITQLIFQKLYIMKKKIYIILYKFKIDKHHYEKITLEITRAFRHSRKNSRYSASALEYLPK